MTRRMARISTAIVLVGLILSGSVRESPAQTVVVSIKSFGELLGDLESLAKAAAPDPDMAAPILQALSQLNGPDSLKGLDRSRPLGVRATLPNGPDQPLSLVVAVPITNLDSFLQSVAAFGLMVDDKPGIPGFSHKIDLPNGTTSLYVVGTKDYAYLSMFPVGADKLRDMPPSAWLPKRAGLGDLSLTVQLDQLPPEFRQNLINQMEQSAGQDRARRPEETESEYRARMAGMDLALNGFKRLILDGSELALDLNIDRKANEVSVEFALGAQDGTPLAQTMQRFANRKSRFQGLAQNAPMAVWMSLPIVDELRKPMSEAFENARRDAAEKLETPEDREIVQSLGEAIRPTLTADSIDFGLAFQGPFPTSGGKPSIVGVLGLQLVNGKTLDRVLREAVKKSPPKDGAEFTLDFAKAADGTPIHRLTGPINKDDNLEAFGAKPAAFFALRDDVALVTFGENGQNVLETSLASVGQASRPTDPPVAAMIQASRLPDLPNTNPDAAKAAVDAAAKVFAGPDAKHDRFRLSLRGDGNALRLRMSMDVPVLRFLATVGGTTANARNAAP